jgi:hypothetical protein
MILVTFLIDRMTAGYMLAVQAHGKIAAYQATVGTSLVLTLPLAWLFLRLGFAPTSVGVAFIITMAVCTFGRVLWARHLLGVSVYSWFDSVVFRCGLVAIVATLAALAPGCLLPPSLIRLALTFTASIAASLITAWFIAFDRNERDFLGQNTRRLLGKISGKCRRREKDTALTRSSWGKKP